MIRNKENHGQNNTTAQTPAEYYLQERNNLDQDLIRESSKSDNAKLLVITGSILLSTNYARSFNGELQCKCMLIIGCSLLVLALISHFSSFEFAMKWYEKKIEEIEEWREREYESKPFKENKSEKLRIRAQRANQLTFILLIGGILVIVIFFIINLF